MALGDPSGAADLPARFRVPHHGGTEDTEEFTEMKGPREASVPLRASVLGDAARAPWTS